MTAAAAAGRRCVEILISNAARRSIIYNSLSIHKEGKDITGPSIYICNAAGIGCHRRRYGDSRTRGGFLRRRDGIKRLDFFLIISFHFFFFFAYAINVINDATLSSVADVALYIVDR